MEYQYIKILCEGQSEESFIKKILAPYLEKRGSYIQPIVLGGVSHYSQIRRELRCLGRDSAAIAELKKDVKKFFTPEHVNNSEQTAPSKRILRAYQYYQKVSDGTIVAESVGIESMIEKCPHFAGWVKKIGK